MKTLVVVSAFLLLAVSGYAQTIKQSPLLLPPIHKKPLNPDYLKQATPMGLNQFKNKYLGSTIIKRPLTLYKSTPSAQKGKVSLKSGMPILKPDTTTKSYILAMKPDSTMLHHLQIKKMK